MVRLTEQELKKIIRKTVNEAFDYWRDAEDSYLSSERLPKGWEKETDEDGNDIYFDGDGNVFTKDEYGHFVSMGD